MVLPSWRHHRFHESTHRTHDPRVRFIANPFPSPRPDVTNTGETTVEQHFHGGKSHAEIQANEALQQDTNQPCATTTRCCDGEIVCVDRTLPTHPAAVVVGPIGVFAFASTPFLHSPVCNQEVPMSTDVTNADPRELILLDRARTALLEARTVDEVRDLRDKAQAVRAYVRKARLGHNILLEAAAIKLRAERRLGEMLQLLPLARSAPGNQHKPGCEDADTNGVRLQEIGISKSESSRLQKIASLPESQFEQYVEGNLLAEIEPTTAGCLRLVGQIKRAAQKNESSPPNEDPTTTTSLKELAEADYRFATIYADPPWKYGNQATRAATDNHYPTMSTDDICAEPVSELCEPNAHLHLWTTNAFLPDAFDVMDAWGFEYKSCFLWVKPNIGIGNYWRVSHEFLLFGTRGRLPFADRSLRSWQEFKRTRHSEKPEAIRELIQRASPGPYLEMYARRSPANELWTVYGNEVETGLEATA